MIEVTAATDAHVEQFASHVAELFWSTGPASYGYQLGSRTLMDALVAASWPVRGTLFAHDATTLAIADGELLGIEVGFTDPGFLARIDALRALWPGLVESGAVELEQIGDVERRAAQCSWLNPTIPDDVYYIHAIAVTEAHRGGGVGAALMRHALARAEEAGLRAVQLDVLSDNPAVDFYRAFGFDCLVESTAPIPFAAGVPTELRMEHRFGTSA